MMMTRAHLIRSRLERIVGRRWPVVAAVALLSLLIGFGLAVLTVDDGQVAHSGPLSPGARGVWVVRHMLRTPASIDRAIATAQEVGADTLFVQVNGRMEAYYDSALLPAAADMAPDFDALAYVIRRAHAEGIQVHAWINAFTAGMLTDLPQAPEHVLHRHPDWMTVDQTGRSLWDYSWQEAQVYVPARMLDPGLPDVQRFVVDVVLEVVDKYDVDGVHLDYVRYPSRRFGYHPESIGRFVEEHGFDPLVLQQDAEAFIAEYGRDEWERRVALWDDWRRAQVTVLVEQLRQELQQRGGRPVFSVAVGADAEDAVTNRLQDWPNWVERRLVDAVVLMAYSADTERVAAHVQHAGMLGEKADVPVYAGIGAYLFEGDAELLVQQLAVVRTAEVAGVAVFSLDTLLEQVHLREALRDAWLDDGPQ